MAGVAHILPISISIVILLGVVYFSYRQTIQAYPQGGGSYTVASGNLGTWAGLLAAASLMIDYVLTAAVAFQRVLVRWFPLSRPSNPTRSPCASGFW